MSRKLPKGIAEEKDLDSQGSRYLVVISFFTVNQHLLSYLNPYCIYVFFLSKRIPQMG